jgi:hypothetical protein
MDMQIEYLAHLIFYGGPDQIMTVTSGLASVLGLLLIFWNKVVGLFFRFVRIFKRTPETASASKNTSTDTQ